MRRSAIYLACFLVSICAGLISYLFQEGQAARVLSSNLTVAVALSLGAVVSLVGLVVGGATLLGYSRRAREIGQIRYLVSAIQE
ncbi:MAG: hypothetical protein KC561_14025 [Myxococcales bacterium]|nr:hypothetical protein [Myxococcales bacterium]